MADNFEDKSDEIHGLATAQNLPNRLQDIHSELLSTNPNVGAEVNNTAQRAIQFLQSKQPSRGAQSIEDTKVAPSKTEQNKFMNYHNIINDPLSVLDHIKNSTLTSHHVEAMQSVYPDLHAEIKEKLVSELSDMKNKGKTLSYAKRQAVGKYLGMPLDSTMSLPMAQSVMQANAGAQNSQMQGQQKQHKASGKELDQIDKVNQLYNTPLEQRLSNKKA